MTPPDDMTTQSLESIIKQVLGMVSTAMYAYSDSDDDTEGDYECQRTAEFLRDYIQAQRDAAVKEYQNGSVSERDERIAWLTAEVARLREALLYVRNHCFRPYAGRLCDNCTAIDDALTPSPLEAQVKVWEAAVAFMDHYGNTSDTLGIMQAEYVQKKQELATHYYKALAALDKAKKRETY